MIDPVYKRLLAENAWLRQQIAQLQEEHESNKKEERHNAYLEILKKDTPEDIALHNEIVDKVARHHGKMHPHMTTHISGGAPDTENSIAHIKDTLAAPGIWQRPLFKSVDHALDYMKDDGGFTPYHLTQPNGYMGDDDDRYSEMLVGVKHSIDTEEEKKK